LASGRRSRCRSIRSMQPAGTLSWTVLCKCSPRGSKGSVPPWLPPRRFITMRASAACAFLSGALQLPPTSYLSGGGAPRKFGPGFPQSLASIIPLHRARLRRSGYVGEKVAKATLIAEIVRKNPDQVGFAFECRRRATRPDRGHETTQNSVDCYLRRYLLDGFGSG
jgi:hypothetical protein